MKPKAPYLIALLLGFSSCDKAKDAVPAPDPIDKTVVFEVFGSQDFSYSRYGEEEISIRFVITRKQKETVNAVETVVVDSSFTMALKDIPVQASRLTVTKVVPAVQDAIEHVFIGSGYTYRQNSFGKNETLPASQLEKKVQLTIY